MKKILLVGLFILGLGFALSQFTGLAGQGTYDSIVLDFRDDLPASEIEGKVEAIAAQYNVTPRLNSEFSESDHVFVLEGNADTLCALQKDSILKKETEFIEANYIYSTFEVPNDPDYSKQWNFQNINLEQAWKRSTGKGVTVAVIDTGVSQVPDLKQTKIVEGYDFVNNRKDATDDNGHGTHVAGTIAQSTNNNYGVAGVAYKAKIMPLKVLSAQGGGTVSDIAEAIRFAADHGADVINMSLGGGGASTLMQDAIDYAYGKGVAIIAAAGNSGRNASEYPGRYNHVLSVAALDKEGNKAPYSNYGAGVNISAPGGSDTGKIIQETINSSTGKPVFAGFQGTSMASPHVAGVAALLKAEGVANPDQIFQILEQSAQKVEDDVNNYFGAGRLDAAAAVQLVANGPIDSIFKGLRDMLRWLWDNFFVNPWFWFDGGVVALLPKVLMAIAAYLLAWLMRRFSPFVWTGMFTSGLILGSCGLFFLKGLYLFDLPQWPLRVMGSSIPELGSAIEGTSILNPIFASVLIPLLLLGLLLGNPKGKDFAIGATLGVAACLGVSAILTPTLWGLGSGVVARLFLLTNAILCFGLAKLASKKEGQLI